jgi:hypothetical protein
VGAVVVVVVVGAVVVVVVVDFFLQPEMLSNVITTIANTIIKVNFLIFQPPNLVSVLDTTPIIYYK